MVYTFIVTVSAKDEASLQAVITKLQPLVAHSNFKESGTLSYEISRPDEADAEKPAFTLVERYTDKVAFSEVHCKSALYGQTMEWIGGNVEALGLTLGTHGFATIAEAPAQKNDAEERPAGVLVFCGSREGTDPLYKEKATELGKLMAEQKKPLVYGGGTVGLMGAIAEGCNSNGGDVTGVIPRALIPREMTDSNPPFTPIYVDTMAIRKSKMFELSGTVISMPGGIGTFDELLEVLTLFQLNAYRPKIGLLNVKGFYDPFLATLDRWIEAGFVNADAKDYMVISADPAELLKGLDAHVPPPSVKKLEWTAKP